MDDDLAMAQVEVLVCTYGGIAKTYLTYEKELHEEETFVFPETAFARAEAWLARYAAKMGWKAI